MAFLFDRLLRFQMDSIHFIKSKGSQIMKKVFLLIHPHQISNQFNKNVLITFYGLLKEQDLLPVVKEFLKTQLCVELQSLNINGNLPLNQAEKNSTLKTEIYFTG